MKFSVIKQQRLWWTISSVVILSGLIAMAISWSQFGSPLRPGLDFVGGTRLQVELDCSKQNNCDKPIDTNVVREVLDSKGLGSSSSIQVLGKDQHGLSIRAKALDVDQRTQLVSDLSAKLGAFDPQKNSN